MSKFINMNGLSNVIFSSGDFNASDRPNDYMYRLHAFPFTLITRHQQVIDDSLAFPVGVGDWNVRYGFGGYYDDTIHDSASPGTSLSYTFHGNSIAWVGGKNVNHGYASVSIDHGPAVLVDTYAPRYEYQQVLFQKNGLSNGVNTITITVTGQKDPSSSGLFEDIDAFIAGH